MVANFAIINIAVVGIILLLAKKYVNSAKSYA